MFVQRLGRSVIKTRSVPTVTKVLVPSRWYLISSGALAFTTGGGENVIVDSGLEEIRYTTRLKGQPLRANSCRHTKTRKWYSGNCTEVYEFRTPQPNATHRVEYFTHHAASHTPHVQAVIACKAAFGVTLGVGNLSANGLGYINSAMKNLRPDLTTMSLPNFLNELDDIRGLYKLWRTSLTLGKNLAGLHLNVKFGWQPTIADIRTMLESVMALKDRLKQFEDNCGKPIHASETVFKTENSANGQFTSTDGSSRTLWTGSVIRTCTAHLVYKPRPLAATSRFRRMLSIYLDTLGFELNPRIVWDSLPFTFVIDWFFNFGGWLENFKIDSFELPIDIVDTYLQYKEEVRIESTYHQNEFYAQNKPWVRCPSWVTTERFFQRMPISPDYSTFADLGWRFPTLNQATLLVSLVTVLKK